MVVKKEYISTLERISKDVQSQSDTLRIVAPELKNVPGIEDELLEVAADLIRCAVRLNGAVESIRDWNSRHGIPIP